MNQRKKCPICNNQSTISDNDYGQQLIIDCGSCGSFQIISSLSEKIKSDKNGYIIAGHLYATKTNRPQEYLLNKEKINSILSEPFNKPADITEQLDALLLYIEKNSSYAGAETNIPLFSKYPVVYAISPKGFSALFDLLKEMQYIRIIKISNIEHFTIQVKLLYKGYQRLQEFKKTTRNAERCFVAMPINKELKSNLSMRIA